VGGRQGGKEKVKRGGVGRRWGGHERGEERHSEGGGARRGCDRRHEKGERMKRETKVG